MIVAFACSAPMGIEIVSVSATAAVTITRVLPQSQAARAGLLPGDVLCYARSDGANHSHGQAIPYNAFLELIRSSQTHLHFYIRRSGGISAAEAVPTTKATVALDVRPLKVSSPATGMPKRVDGDATGSRTKALAVHTGIPARSPPNHEAIRAAAAAAAEQRANSNALTSVYARRPTATRSEQRAQKRTPPRRKHSVSHSSPRAPLTGPGSTTAVSLLTAQAVASAKLAEQATVIQLGFDPYEATTAHTAVGGRGIIVTTPPRPKRQPVRVSLDGETTLDDSRMEASLA
jgi:hypothetical protein